jgi:hypothetical protein
MPDLELTLRDLGTRLDWPAEPELAPGVLAGLALEPKRRLRVSRRALVIALAVAAVAIGAVFAVPQTRAAVLEFFHLRGVTIERVPELPTVPVEAGLGTFLGERVSLDEARRRAGFDVVVPKQLGEPDEVYIQRSPPGGMVSFLYGSREHPTALFTQFAATVDETIFKKVAPETSVVPVSVDGRPGFWIQGAHYFQYLDRQGEMRTEQVRLAGSVLLWERGPLTLRLEADVSRDEAIRIAQSVG